MKTSRPNSTPLTRWVEIDFLYLDLTVCQRCCGTDKNLRAALKLLEPVLKAMGVRTQVRKTQVTSERQARALAFVSSPTIRVNGRDIAGELSESRCGACGVGAPVNCRVWSYQGREDTQAPVGLIVESILREVIGTAQRPTRTTLKSRPVPENLKRYFAGKAPPRGSFPCTTRK